MSYIEDAMFKSKTKLEAALARSRIKSRVLSIDWLRTTHVVHTQWIVNRLLSTLLIDLSIGCCQTASGRMIWLELINMLPVGSTLLRAGDILKRLAGFTHICYCIGKHILLICQSPNYWFVLFVLPAHWRLTRYKLCHNRVKYRILQFILLMIGVDEITDINLVVVVYW